MLYITLNKGDYVMVGDNIRVYYEKPNGDNGFMIGIEAPKDVSILRSDLYKRMLAEESGEVTAHIATQTIEEDYLERRNRNDSGKARRRQALRVQREQALNTKVPAEA